MSLIPRTFYAELAAIIAVLVFVIAIWFSYNFSPFHPGYAVNISLTSTKDIPLFAGTATVDITPDIVDTWEDLDHDGVYNRWNDIWHDINENGKFDAYWMAGFERSKPATSTFTPLSAKALVLKKGNLSIGIVAIDTIGIFYEETIRIRTECLQAQSLDHLLIVPIHTHAAPDTLGYWSPDGANQEYLAFVRNRINKALKEAKQQLVPVNMKTASVDVSDLLTDVRPEPFLVNPQLTAIEFIPQQQHPASASIVLAFAGCHPTLLGRNSTRLSSDWVGFFREKVRNLESQKKRKCIFLNGTGGGQIVPNAPESHTPFPERVISATRIGNTMASRIDSALNNADITAPIKATLGIQARTIKIPIENKLLWLAIGIGHFGRGTFFPMKIRTETGILKVGNLTAAIIPGEMFPEQFIGGETNPQGADYQTAPVEVPPMADLLPGDHKVVIGLANDEIGYLVPYSEWDMQKPHINNQSHSYGQEKLCPGPHSASNIHNSIAELSRMPYETK